MCPSSTSSSDPSASGATAEGLVAVDDELPPGAQGLLAKCVLGGFLACIVGTSLVDTFAPAPRPELMGRELAEDEALREEMQFLDGSAARFAERELRIRSRVRATLLPPYSLAIYRALGESGPRVVAGSDGWLFMADRVVPPDVSAEEIVAPTVALLTALDRRLGSMGARMVVAPIPRKCVVLREHLPLGVDPRPEIEQLLSRRLREAGVTVADLAGALAREQEQPLYFKADTHWTEQAELLAAEEIARTAGVLVPEAERSTTLRSTEGEFTGNGDLLEFMGIRTEAGAPPVVSAQVVRYHDLFQGKRPLGKVQGTPMARILLVGTSFSANRKLATYLGHVSDEQVWNASRLGVDPIQQLPRVVQQSKGGPDSVVVVELPVHLLFRRVLEPEHLSPFPMELPTMAMSNEFMGVVNVEPALAQGPGQIQEPIRLAQIPPGHVASSGDGVLGLRVRGKLKGGVVLLELGTGRNVAGSLGPNRPTVVSPLLGADDEAIPLMAWSKNLTDITVDAIEIVAELDPTRAVARQAAAPTATAGGWEQVVRFPAVEFGRQAGVLLRLDVAGPFDGAFSVAIEIDGAPPRPPRVFGGMHRECVVALNVGDLRGAGPLTVRLRGLGEPPERCLRRALLMPPPGPWDEP